MNNVARPLFLFFLRAPSMDVDGARNAKQASFAINFRTLMLSSFLGNRLTLAENVTTSTVYHSVSTASGDVHHRM